MDARFSFKLSLKNNMNSLKFAVFLSLSLSHSLRRRKCSTGPHAAQRQKQEMWKKKKVQTFIINQQKCRRIVTPGGKVSEGSDKLESSERIRRVDKCALSLLLFTL